jgi:lipopolysaccharide-binding protein
VTGILLQTFSMDAIAGLEGNNITAQVTLNDLTLQLKWSEIGKFPVKLMQVVAFLIAPLLSLLCILWCGAHVM